MALSARVWRRLPGGTEAQLGNAWARTDGRKEVPEAELKQREAEARASQVKESGDSLAAYEGEDGCVTAQAAGGARELRKWRASLSGPEQERPLELNEKQREVVERVVSRMIEECTEDDSTRGSGEPLLWMLHGGPGTGKSYVVDALWKRVWRGHGVVTRAGLSGGGVAGNERVGSGRTHLARGFRNDALCAYNGEREEERGGGVKEGGHRKANTTMAVVDYR